MDISKLNLLWNKHWKKLEEEGIKGTKLPGMSAERTVMNIQCPFCTKCDWKSFPDNTSAYDLQCNACFRYYQVKAKKNLVPSILKRELCVMGTTFQTTYDSIGYVCYIIVSYNNKENIRNVYVVDASAVSNESVKKWNTKPLCTLIFKKGAYTKLRMI